LDRERRLNLFDHVFRCKLAATEAEAIVSEYDDGDEVADRK
jgi:hypothetical protein